MISPKLIALLAVALVIAGLTAFGLYWKAKAQECLVTVATLTGQIALLGQQIAEQNVAVDNLAQEGSKARQAGAQATQKAQEAQSSHLALLAHWNAQIAAGEATGSGCPAGAAVGELRGKK